MIIALIAGSLDDKRFPGRNTFPLLGRPLVSYPILAALHAQTVDRVYVTTNTPAIGRIARHHNAQVIERPPEVAGPDVSLEAVLAQAYGAARKETKEEIEAVVVLLANAPTVTSQMIDQGVELLRREPALDAVTVVAQRNEFHPQFALTIGGNGLLATHPLAAGGKKEADAYFDASVLWVLRPSYFDQQIKTVRPNAIINAGVQKVRPMVFEGHGDVDYPWQVPGVAEWLRRHGFSEEATPYDPPAPVLAPPAVVPRAPRVGGKSIERRVLITTVPFGEPDRAPLDLLEAAGIEYVVNPLQRKLKESELMELAKDFGVIIAGTEPNSRRVMEGAPHLRFISRVGVGLDSVDLAASRERGILVSYTPEAPAPAVAELAVALMVSLLRAIPQSDHSLRQGVWHRSFGRRLANCTVGLIGIGRIGKRVVGHLGGFSPKRILANDLAADVDFGHPHHLEWTDKETIYREADIISLHVPLTPLTHNLITEKELARMKPSTLLVNTARGGIINEKDLAHALRGRIIAGAALDTYLQEPYSGELIAEENCILTSHLGSMSVDCRGRMEREATEEAIRFLQGKPLLNLVPEAEYTLQLKR